MKYCLEIPARDYKRVLECMTTAPYVGQAAFCLLDKKVEGEWCYLKITSIVSPRQGDYLGQSADGFAISPVFLINTLGQANAENRSLLYIHTHPAGPDHDCRANGDEKMLFRIAYGICPFGTHASLVFKRGKLTGNIWLPNLETAPLFVIPSHCLPEGRPQNIFAKTRIVR